MGPWEIGIMLLVPVSLAIYLLPIIIAAAKHKRDMLGVVLLNVLAGWSLVGWIISLVWAFSPDRDSTE